MSQDKMQSASVTTSHAGSAGPTNIPAEKPAAIWTRRAIIAAFWAVAVCLGLPHWTWTTSIERSTLPLDAMNTWAEGKACTLKYPLQIALEMPNMPTELTRSLASNLEASLNQMPNFGLHTFHVAPNTTSSPNNVLTILLATASGSVEASATLRAWQPVMDASHPSTSQIDVESVSRFLVSEVFRVFEDESASLSHLIKGTPFGDGLKLADISPERNSALDRRTTRAFKYASNYHVTFSLFTPGASPSAWEIDRALDEYISPLLTPLSAISNFKIDTQVQLYASFSPSIAGPVFDSEKSHWTLSYSDLTGFVNAAEWPLSPSVGTGPTINFVLYVPAPDKRPLLIDQSGGTGWVIPQWGGVQIHNNSTAEQDTLTWDALRPDLLTFADQLTSLIGLPESPPSLSLRISSLTRERATSLILSASSTLGALSRLTLKLTSIAIPRSVADSVDETLRQLDQACTALQSGHFQDALAHARIAEAEAEQAFFEPSMVGQVYFPEEHKVAVYVPLLGPMAVPLVMAALKEFKALRQRKAKTT